MKQHPKAADNRLNSKQLSIIAIALLMLAFTTTGLTVAWITATTEPVTNTFVSGNINLTLTETDTGIDSDSDFKTNSYVMTPSAEITKDPKVTVAENSVDCWLFAKVDKSENFDTFLTSSMAAGWTTVPGKPGVYYREVAQAATAQEFSVLLNDKVTVKNDVTKPMLDALDADPAHTAYPTLTVTAYAVQKLGFDSAADAWSQVEPAP